MAPGSRRLGASRQVDGARGIHNDGAIAGARLEQLADLLLGPLTTGRPPVNRSEYPELARELGPWLDASFCCLATVDKGDVLVLHGTGGHRPPSRRRGRWPLADLPLCAEAVSAGAPVVADFNRQATPEQELLFTATTKVGAIVPFTASGITGVLIVGEERWPGDRRSDTKVPAILRVIAARLGELVAAGMAADGATGRGGISAIRKAERRRVAVALHDDVGQALTMLLMQLRVAIHTNDTSAVDLRTAETLVGESLDAVRSLAREMHGGAESPDPLPAARAYAERALLVAGCRLTWVDRRKSADLDQEVAQEIANVIREAVTNVVRHARASRVTVRLGTVGRHTRVIVSDDGVGVAAMATGSNGLVGLGLQLSAERISAVGGSLQLSRTPRGGMRLVLKAPSTPG